jgi:hypothetical protein
MSRRAADWGTGSCGGGGSVDGGSSSTASASASASLTRGVALQVVQQQDGDDSEAASVQQTHALLPQPGSLQHCNSAPAATGAAAPLAPAHKQAARRVPSFGLLSLLLMGSSALRRQGSGGSSSWSSRRTTAAQPAQSGDLQDELLPAVNASPAQDAAEDAAAAAAHTLKQQGSAVFCRSSLLSAAVTGGSCSGGGWALARLLAWKSTAYARCGAFIAHILHMHRAGRVRSLCVYVILVLSADSQHHNVHVGHVPRSMPATTLPATALVQRFSGHLKSCHLKRLLLLLLQLLLHCLATSLWLLLLPPQPQLLLHR